MADTARGGATSSLRDSIMSTPAAERLKQEALAFAAVHAERLLASAGRRLGRASTMFNDLAEGRSPGLVKLVKEGGRKFAEGKGPVRSAVEIGASHVGSKVKNKVKNAVPRLGGGKRKTGNGKRKAGGGKRKAGGRDKFVTIVEDIDVGVPVREAYNQWTQFQEFSTFAKGVQVVDAADDTSTTWRAKVLWATRSWTGTTTEQIPDERIAWTSEGAKGTTKGVVTFHPLGENLTKVLLVVEYYPKGLLEKTANIWRAQGRRARLDLKHFRRFVTIRGEATGEWRGEIRDGEVVLSHEDAVAEEGRELGPQDEEFEARDSAEPEESAEDDEYAELYDDAEEDEEYPDEEYAEDLADEEEEYDEDLAEDEDEEDELTGEDEEYEPDELVETQPKRGQRT